jgi:hypothetical protein
LSYFFKFELKPSSIADLALLILESPPSYAAIVYARVGPSSSLSSSAFMALWMRGFFLFKPEFLPAAAEPIRLDNY